MPPEYGLHAFEHRHEEAAAIVGRFDRRLDHETDRVSGTLSQAAAGLVRDIAELFRREEHALAGFGIDVGLAIQRPRNSSDRNI